MVGARLSDVRRELRSFADPERARLSQRYFKTGRGEYAEGDLFLGLGVPAVRAVARRHRDLPMQGIRGLLRSRWHEERLLALVILVGQFRRGTPAEREAIHRVYLANTRYINNWDLVDASAKAILGEHVDPGDDALLQRLARSKSVWERRMAVLDTFAWLPDGTFEPSFRLARALMEDPHDLIHKAAGWMLREVWSRDAKAAEAFLREHRDAMPRTMLRYAIEKMPPRKRRHFLRGNLTPA